MLRRLIVITALAAGMSIAAALTLATPALAKGPSQARITGPGLAHAIVVSGNGEPGQPSMLDTLAMQTKLFIVMFGANATVPPQTPPQLRTPPPKSTLGPRYMIIYTVPGFAAQPGEQFGQIRQYLYPRAVGGPVIYTPPGQHGPVLIAGWLRASPGLPRTLGRLGVPSRLSAQTAHQTRFPHAAHPAAAHQASQRTLAWLIASVSVIAAAAITGTALWLRHRNPASPNNSQPRTTGPTVGST
jgi:hypothetical protein